MKKMLILVMLVGMASVASAGLIMSVSSGVVAIEGGTAGYASALVVTGSLAPVVELDAAVPATFSAINPYGLMNPADAQLPGIDPSFVYEIAIGGDTTAPLLAGTHVIITTNAAGFSAVDQGLGSVYFVNMTSGEAFTAYATPEPMTMALLGLGGLFLRRRK